MISAEAILLDLFDTLITVDLSRLPVMCVDDQFVPSTLPVLLPLLQAAAPKVPKTNMMSAIVELRARPPERDEANVEIPEHHFFSALLSRLGIPDDGAEIAQRLADAQMAAIVAACRPMPGARFLLAGFRRRGLRTAVVSNLAHASSLDALLAVADPEHHFDAVVTSIEVGFCKPDRRPFQLALKRLGVPSDRTLHVGDDPLGDVGGAASVGIQPIWFNPSRRAWPGDGDRPTTVSTLMEVEALTAMP